MVDQPVANTMKLDETTPRIYNDGAARLEAAVAKGVERAADAWPDNHISRLNLTTGLLPTPQRLRCGLINPVCTTAPAATLRITSCTGAGHIRQLPGPA